MYARNNSCFGGLVFKVNHEKNEKKYNLKSSTNTLNKKLLAVTSEHAEKQTIKANVNCPNNVQITNTGGPGDNTHSQNKKCCIKNGWRNRLVDHGVGIDKKHNSYDRYLARKTGWVLRDQLCAKS